MKAVLLAAGEGMRLRPLTEAMPKPMVPIIDRPLMELLIDVLRGQGFDEIIIATAYLAPHIENYFRDGSHFGVQIAYSFEGYHVDGLPVREPLGAAGGLKKIQDASGFFDDTFAVLCGDALIDLDFSRLIAFHRQKHAAVTMLLREVPRNEVHKYGVVALGGDGRIERFQEKPATEEALSNTINAGVYLFEPSALDLIPSHRPFDIAADFFPALLDSQLPFYGMSLPCTWIDIGRLSDYWLATRMVLNEEVNFVRMSGREIAPKVWAGINISLDLTKVTIQGPVSIGSSTIIEPGAVIIGPTVIGRNSVIESGAHIESCIIGDYTRVSGLADFRDKIISGRFCVDQHGRSVNLAQAGYTFVIDDARERRTWTEDQQFLMNFLRTGMTLEVGG
jgi:mannose-1-phosphate guanylyltransferase